MDNLVILLIIETIFLIANWYLFNGDIASPSVMSCLVIYISTWFATYAKDIWKLKISYLTVITIGFGLFCMLLGNLLARSVVIKFGTFKFKGDKLSDTKPIPEIKIKKTVAWSLTLLTIVGTCLYGLEAYRVGISNGGTSFNAFGYMKESYMNDGTIKMNIIIRQIFKFVTAIGYIYTFIFTNNVMILKKKIISNLVYLIPIICTVLITIFSGSRAEILRIFSAFFLNYMILLRESKGWKKNVRKSTKETIKKVIPYIIIIIIIAYISKTLVKTSDVATGAIDSILYYAAFYIGSSIAVLNTKLDSIVSFKTFLLGDQSVTDGFVYLGNLDYGGNCASIFANILNDGLIGMGIFIFVLYLMISILYKTLLIETQSSKKRNRDLIILSFLYCIITMAYYASMIGYVIGFSGLLTIIVILIMYYFIMSHCKLVI